MVNEIRTENVPSHAESDLTLYQKRVCEVGEKQWCIDRHESGVTHTSQWWNPCDEEGPYSFREKCLKTCSLTGDFDPIAGLPGRAAMPGERNFSSSSGSLNEYMVNECHTENVPFYTSETLRCAKKTCLRAGGETVAH